MNQISRFCVCRRSILRRNPITRWSSKPLSSSLISNNPTSANLIRLVSKFHHTFNYPPQILSTPRNHFQKFSGAEGCNSDDAYLKKEISKVYEAIMDAQDNIELGTLPPLAAVKIPADKFDALMEKLGLDSEKAGDYPPHLQRFREKIESLEECVDETVAFGKYAAAGTHGGRPRWRVFTDWYYGRGKFELESENESYTLPAAQDQIAMRVGASTVVAENLADNTNQAAAERNFDHDYLQKEIYEVYEAIIYAAESIELGTLPPLDAVKIPADKFNALTEKLGLDKEVVGDYPHHPHIFTVKIRTLEDVVDEIVAFGEYVAAGKNSGPPRWSEFMDEEESSEFKNKSDTLPAAQDQIVMRVDDASAVVAENLADNTN